MMFVDPPQKLHYTKIVYKYTGIAQNFQKKNN